MAPHWIITIVILIITGVGILIKFLQIKNKILKDAIRQQNEFIVEQHNKSAKEIDELKTILNRFGIMKMPGDLLTPVYLVTINDKHQIGFKCYNTTHKYSIAQVLFVKRENKQLELVTFFCGNTELTEIIIDKLQREYKQYTISVHINRELQIVNEENFREMFLKAKENAVNHNSAEAMFGFLEKEK